MIIKIKRLQTNEVILVIDAKTIMDAIEVLIKSLDIEIEE